MYIINNALLQVIGTLIAATNVASSSSSSSSIHDDTKKLRGYTNLRPAVRRLEKPTTCFSTLVSEVQHEDNHHESHIECEQEDGTMYVIPMSDEEVNQHKYDIAIGKSQAILPAGTMINEQSGKMTIPPGLQVSFEQRSDNTPWGDRRRLAVTGTRSVLVVRIEAADATTGFSEAALSDSVFGTSGDAVNLKSQFTACSHDVLNFQEATGTGIIGGATTVTVSTSTSEGDSAMRNAATTALNDKFGVSSPTQIADHVMYCLPPATMTGIAYAGVYSWYSVYRNEWCNYVSVQLHEIGHNIGFGHSWDGNTEYADQSCMMGYSYSQDDTRMCFNGPKSYQAGWYNTNYNGYATFTYSQAAQENTKLIGQVDYPSVNQDIVVIKIETGTSTDYFIHFNRAVDANSGTKEGANQVLITSAGNNGLSYAKSTLLVKLSAGGTYTLSLTEGDVEVTVNSIDTSASVGYADISISTGTEAPSKSPSSSPSMSPTTKAPSKSPSSSPSASPTISEAPSKTPTPPPSKSPTLKPTLAPTPSPIPCTLAKIDQSCSTGSDCCSGLCTGGNPRNRVCYSNTPTTPAPVAPSTPAPVAPPTTQPPVTSPPVGSCSPWKGQCSNNSDCCSNDCKRNGTCN